MSEKPFARAEVYGPNGFNVPQGQGTHAVIIDTPEGDRCVWPGSEPYARNSADRINAAVEAREAKLRGPLEGLAAAATQYAEAVGLQRRGTPVERGDVDSYSDMRLANRERVAGNALLDAIDAAALTDAGPAYVPAAELAAVQAQLKQLQAAADAIDTVEGDAFFSAADKCAASGTTSSTCSTSPSISVWCPLRLAASSANCVRSSSASGFRGPPRFSPSAPARARRSSPREETSTPGTWSRSSRAGFSTGSGRWIRVRHRQGLHRVDVRDVPPQSDPELGERSLAVVVQVRVRERPLQPVDDARADGV